MHALVAPLHTRTLVSQASRVAAQVVGAVAVMTLLSQILIPLPFTPVPLSLGSLGAMLVGAVLKPRIAVAGAGLYGVLGAAGLPILAGFGSGFMIASFGYVIGYVLAAGLVSYLVHRPGARSYVASAGIAFASTAVIYAAGVVWLSAVFATSLVAALEMGVLPFLAGDALKAAVLAGTVFVVSSRGKSW